MEKKNKIYLLVEKLQTLVADNAGEDKLIATTQLLLAELQFSSNQVQNSKKVAVVFPNSHSYTVRPNEIDKALEEIVEEQEQTIPTPEIVYKEPAKEEEPVKEHIASAIIVEEAPSKYVLNKPAAIEQPQEADMPEEISSNEPHPFIKDEFNIWQSYSTPIEAPTLVQNKPDTLTTNKEVNETLKEEKVELAQSYQQTPIENLHTAIGINDRYLYISELFRDDEAMYERSIITLNKFTNYSQAHSWVERELHLKLGWNMKSEAAQQFEALLKRRFMG